MGHAFIATRRAIPAPSARTIGGTRRARDLIALAALLSLVSASGCGQQGEPYGSVHDAGLSADTKSLLLLVERGTKRKTTSGGLWTGDITTDFPETMEIHEFDRASGTPGRVFSHPPPDAGSPRGRESLVAYAAKDGITASPLKDCRELYTECAETTAPQPYMLDRRVVDPQGGKAIAWDGRRLAVTPFDAMSPAQIRAAREALLRRSVERMHAAAMKDFAARATTEDPERIETTHTGTAEPDPGMTASYRLIPGRVIHARFEYPEARFTVVWDRNGACVTDSAAIAALVAGCRASDEGGLGRAVRGIAQARPPDPDRMGTSWGVVATSDRPETPAGTVTVACHGKPAEGADKPCTERDGNTACRKSLPMLCSKADASHVPQSPWARRLALTAPVRGTDLLSVDGADQLCQRDLGDGWKMTHSDELGYKYTVTGVGSLPATSRFWVRYGDGLANCW